MERVIVTRPFVGICHMQVCAIEDATDVEILAVANTENVAGTEHGWSTVIRDGEKGVGPARCADHGDRLHLLLEC